VVYGYMVQNRMPIGFLIFFFSLFLSNTFCYSKKKRMRSFHWSTIKNLIDHINLLKKEIFNKEIWFYLHFMLLSFSYTILLGWDLYIFKLFNQTFAQNISWSMDWERKQIIPFKIQPYSDVSTLETSSSPRLWYILLEH
jgi:hypothetical protein